MNSGDPAKDICLKLNPSLVLRDVDFCLFHPLKFKIHKYSPHLYCILKEIEKSSVFLRNLLNKIEIKKEDEDKLVSFFEFNIEKGVIQIYQSH